MITYASLNMTKYQSDPIISQPNERKKLQQTDCGFDQVNSLSSWKKGTVAVVTDRKYPYRDEQISL